MPYTDHAYAETHPDRLAVVARLAGWEPPAIARARVLELGCGRGGNLLAMATWLPGAELVGVDRSGAQIAEARRVAGETRLSNVVFHEASFERAQLAPEAFDYVVCHGVWSWVSIESRRELLRVVARSLAPGGVAYVSFNALPGWYGKMAARDWMRLAGARGEDPSAALAWLVAQVSPELAAHRRELGEVAQRLAETDRAYLVHEHLAEEHHPEHVRTFLGEAGLSGLAYLGDAIPEDVAVETLPEPVARRVRSVGVDEAQEIVDFVRCASFRRALLVRADACAARGWRWTPALDTTALRGMRIGWRARLRGDVVEGPRGSLHVPLASARQALEALALAAPRAIPFEELAEGPSEAGALATELFDVWLATGGLDLHVAQPAFSTELSERPLASPLARWRAANGGPITNAWHHEVRLPDDVVRAVLARADGRTTPQDIARALGEDAPLVRASLELLAASALLMDEATGPASSRPRPS